MVLRTILLHQIDAMSVSFGLKARLRSEVRRGEIERAAELALRHAGSTALWTTLHDPDEALTALRLHGVRQGLAAAVRAGLAPLSDRAERMALGYALLHLPLHPESRPH